MTKETLYTIGDLARAAGVTARTIRYYTAEGLLPPPETRTRYALYTDVHLHRLWLIQKLKKAYLPLSAIRTQVEGLTDAQVQDLLAAGASPKESAPGDEARDLPTPPPRARAVPAPEPRNPTDYLARVLAASSPPAVSRASAHLPHRQRVLLVSPWLRPLPPETPPAPAALAEAGGPADAQADLWKRIVLAPGIELHVRVPDSPEARERLDRALTEAKTLFQSLR